MTSTVILSGASRGRNEVIEPMQAIQKTSAACVKNGWSAGGSPKSYMTKSVDIDDAQVGTADAIHPNEDRVLRLNNAAVWAVSDLEIVPKGGQEKRDRVVYEDAGVREPSFITGPSSSLGLSAFGPISHNSNQTFEERANQYDANLENCWTADNLPSLTNNARVCSNHVYR
eukprot:CAMPEP_0115598896 /NCGR_PEP_ID=MMETSP0272-20121206/14112_1 /TAXON_ID=71861 /ORGANISM="Scrippsiella trochoidea, Strain CCMP3099" /LENGTH=170 /DNA_ID=CAMNT_0003034329 /DNA_START=92 /DNA_END=604 /DNA_ORIENTATION=+